MTPAPQRARGLAHQLAWRLAAVMLAAILLAAGALAWHTVTFVRGLDDIALQSQAAMVAAGLPAEPGGLAPLRIAPDLLMSFAESDASSLYAVFDVDGRLAASSAPTLASALLPFLSQINDHGFFRVPRSASLPDGLLGFVRVAGPWRVVVAQASEQNEAIVEGLLHTFLAAAIWLLLPIGAATVAIGVLTIRHGLRPLRDASAAAARIDPGRPGVRLPDAGLPGELRPLVGAVNAALARLEQALDAQRRFVADAAHALRTPLAVLTARIDALPDGTDAALRGDIDRTTRVVGQMLAMARLEELPLDVSGHVDLHRVAVQAISDLAPLAIGRNVELVLSEHDKVATVQGNHEAVVLALTNLLDNALAHAPAGSAVEVELSGPATLRVLDRGPGVPSAARADIFSRFRRGVGVRRQGSGLGLAIVAEIAAAHGGSIGVDDRPGGGAAFTLRLAA